MDTKHELGENMYSSKIATFTVDMFRSFTLTGIIKLKEVYQERISMKIPKLNHYCYYYEKSINILIIIKKKMPFNDI